MVACRFRTVHEVVKRYIIIVCGASKIELRVNKDWCFKVNFVKEAVFESIGGGVEMIGNLIYFRGGGIPSDGIKQ